MSFYVPKLDSDTGGEKFPDSRWELKDDSELVSPSNNLYSQLSERTKEIDSSLIEAKKDILLFKESIKTEVDRIYYFALAIIVAFFLAGIPVFFDYYNNNEERYEKFIDSTKNFYTKEDINVLMDAQSKNIYTKSDLYLLIQENQNNKRILECLKFTGKFSVKCFEY